VRLLERRATLGRLEHFHFEGFSIDGATLNASIRRALGSPDRSVWRFPFWALRLFAPFSRMVRELLEMRYLWTKPLRLDGRKLRAALLDFEFTSLDTAVATTLESAREASEAQVATT
jgi:hypothetical protein